jgi:pSer/pThr/pTyr-binding forkhead associated (FHA) protein
MALILEIRDALGHVRRQRLDGQPIALGRGLSNDVVLDDPYVDARHARIARDETGAWTIIDLGTVNGVLANGARAMAPMPVSAGTEVRIGRTLLHFRDSDEPVSPALVDDEAPVAAVPSAPRAPTPALAPARAPVIVETRPGWRRGAGMLLETTRGRLVVVGVMLAAFAVVGWLGDTTRSPGGSVLAMELALGAMLSLWAVAWAAATRRADRRFHFLAHLAVASAALLGALVASESKDWLSFLFPDSGLVALLFLTAYLALAAAIVAGHLGVAGTMPRRLRWRVGMLVSGAIVVLSVLAYLVRDETFSDTPKFEARLEPLAPAFVPARSVDDFAAVMREAKGKADDDAKKNADP